MAGVASETTVLILAGDQPGDDFGLFLGREGMLEGGECGEGPVTSCYFQVFSQVLTDGVEIFAVV